MADYWGKKFNDRLKLVENELKLKNQKTKDTNRFGMLRDVLDEKTEIAESFTDTPTTLTDNAEETIMIKGRVSRIACQFSNRVEMNGQLDGHKRTWFVEPC